MGRPDAGTVPAVNGLGIEHFLDYAVELIIVSFIVGDGHFVASLPVYHIVGAGAGDHRASPVEHVAAASCVGQAVGKTVRLAVADASDNLVHKVDPVHSRSSGRGTAVVAALAQPAVIAGVVRTADLTADRGLEAEGPVGAGKAAAVMGLEAGGVVGQGDGDRDVARDDLI